MEGRPSSRPTGRGRTACTPSARADRVDGLGLLTGPSAGAGGPRVLVRAAGGGRLPRPLAGGPATVGRATSPTTVPSRETGEGRGVSPETSVVSAPRPTSAGLPVAGNVAGPAGASTPRHAGAGRGGGPSRVASVTAGVGGRGRAAARAGRPVRVSPASSLVA